MVAQTTAAKPKPAASSKITDHDQTCRSVMADLRTDPRKFFSTELVLFSAVA